MSYQIPEATQSKVRGDIAAIRSAYPELDAAEANCVRMNRHLYKVGGKVSYFPYSPSKLSPAVEADGIPGLTA